ncbi:MAG: polysaccharide biosynthesis protein [bacterium]|nr:polysaccharide biosynthesis protein [bacterium]
MSIDQNNSKNSENLAMKSTSLALSAISNWAALLVNVAMGFFLTPYIIEHIGKAQYGIWALVVSIIGYYGLLDLGVASAVMRYIARYVGQKKHESLNQVINTSLVIFLFIGLIALAVSILAVDALGNFFHIAAHDYNEFKLCLWIMGGSAAVMLPTSIFQVAIVAHERFILRNIITIISALLRGTGIIIVLLQGGGLVGISWINFSIIVFTGLLNFIMVKKYFSHIHLSPRFIKKAMAAALLSFGFFSSISQVGILLKTKLDAAVIGRYINMESVGVYSVAALLTGYIMNLTIALSGVFQPRLAAMAGLHDDEALKNAITRFSVIVSTLVMGFGVCTYFCTEDFLMLWVPDNFGEIGDAVIVIFVLTVVIILDMMNDVSVNALRAVNKHKYFALQTIVEGMANLALSIYLATRYGIIGVAVGTLIPTVITKLIIQPIYCCKIFHINWFEFMLKILIRPLLVISTMIAGLTYAEIVPPAYSYPALILKGAVIFGLYIVLAYFFCFSKENRAEIMERFKIQALVNKIRGK